MFEKYVGMKFDEVVEMLSQLEGLVEVVEEDNSILYTNSPYGWCSSDTYEFLFEDDICVGYEVDPYEED